MGFAVFRGICYEFVEIEPSLHTTSYHNNCPINWTLKKLQKIFYLTGHALSVFFRFMGVFNNSFLGKPAWNKA